MRRGLSVERLGRSLLERMGFQVLEARRRVEVGGVEVFEVDLVAKGGNGETYAVEVKAGRVGVSDVRQAYVNAEVLGFKPMIICRGYADEAAKNLAEKLKIRVLQLPDFYALLELEELDFTVRRAVEEALEEYEAQWALASTLSKEEVEALKAIAMSSSFEEAAKLLNTSVKGLEGLVVGLKAKGFKVKGGYQGLRRLALRLLGYLTLLERLERLEEGVRRLLARFEA